jgi:hypothetical protein
LVAGVAERSERFPSHLLDLAFGEFFRQLAQVFHSRLLHRAIGDGRNTDRKQRT